MPLSDGAIFCESEAAVRRAHNNLQIYFFEMRLTLNLTTSQPELPPLFSTHFSTHFSTLFSFKNPITHQRFQGG